MQKEMFIKMRRIIFSLLLLLLLICGLFLVFSSGRNSKTELSKTRLSQDRKFVNGVLSYLGSRSFQTLPYRVLPYGDDSVAFLTETGAFIGDPELHKCIQVQPPEGYGVGLYYLYRDEGRKIAFSVERNAAIIQSNTGNREMQPKGKAFNSIVAGNNLYCVTTDRQMSKIFFEQINLIDGTKKIIADQQSLFANDLIGRSACIEQILEGNFFRINNTLAGFYF